MGDVAERRCRTPEDTAGYTAGREHTNVDHAMDARDREWSTADAPDAEQFALWEAAVDQAFVPVTVTGDQQDGFVSGVTVRRLGAIEIADLAAPAQSVTRSAAQVARSSGDVYFLNLPISGHASAAQDGRMARLDRGDFVVVDGDHPFELQFASRFRQVSLKIPRDLLHPRLREPESATGLGVSGSHGVGLVASSAIRAAFAAAATLDRSTARTLGEHLLDLVALSLGAARPGSAPQHLLLQAALDEVERSLGNADLTATGVAERVGISVRYLHTLFAQHGPSFGRWLLARRLELAHRDLTDPRRSHWSISRVAHERGFSDPSYFARVFRARYGLTPRQFRIDAAQRRGSALSS